jgi:DNA modification methylase
MIMALEQKRKPIPNNLNDLSGKEWIKFTKSWFILRSSRRNEKVLHPACYPEELATEFIRFFTKKGQWVLDPFGGIGSTVIACESLGRNSIMTELYPEYSSIARERLLSLQPKGSHHIVTTSAKGLKQVFVERDLPRVNFTITSPPYWNQLKMNHRRQKSRVSSGLNTTYGTNTDDLGLIDDYDAFLGRLVETFDTVHELTMNGGYLVVVTNNVYQNRRLYPMAFDLVRLLSRKWVPKDERIWCQDDKPLWPFAIFCHYLANRSHQYCLIFRKEN